MLQRASRPFFAVRAFILASPVCTGGAVPSHLVTAHRAPRAYVSSLSPTANQSAPPKPVPYALTTAACAFEEQVQRGELDFLPQAYEHLRQVLLEIDRRGLIFSDTDIPVVPDDTIRRSMTLLAASPQREHAILHLRIFDDLSLLRIRAEVVHPLEFTAQMFHEHIQHGTPSQHIYDHIQHLAEVVQDPQRVFASESATWRAVSWMHRLVGSQTPELLPRILHDLPTLFGLQPTLVHHQLVIKGFLVRDMPDEAWTWLRRMELSQHSTTYPAQDSAIWLKPQTAQYDLLLKHFANRGDVVSVRMLLTHMTRYVEPSQLSYHLLLAAVLRATPTPNQPSRVAAAVEEMERAGHGVHLKTLGGIIGRGSLGTWVTDEVFTLLRASQERSNARTRTVRRAFKAGSSLVDPETIVDHEGQVEVRDDHTKINYNQQARGSGKPHSQPAVNALSDLPPRDISITYDPHISSQHMTTSTTQPVKDSLAISTDSTLSDVRAARASDGPTLPASQTPPVLIGETVANPVFSYVEVGLPNHSSTPINSSARPEDPTHISIHTENTSISPNGLEVTRGTESVSLVHRLWLRKSVSGSLPDPTALPPNLLEGTKFYSERVGNGELGVEPHIHLEHKAGDTPQVSTTSLSQINVPVGSQFDRPNMMRAALISGVEVNDKHKTSESPLGLQESVTPKHSVSGAKDGRLRRKYNRLVQQAIRHGDLREASKLYAEMTAVSGPDIGTGCAMIKFLCRSHLLIPPPRPHILQAMRIYRSLVELEKQKRNLGFFDGANRVDSENLRIRAHVYKDLLRALSSPSRDRASSRDFTPEAYEQYVEFAMELLNDMKARELWLDGKTVVSTLLFQFRGAKSHQEAFKCYQSVVAGGERFFDPSRKDRHDDQTRSPTDPGSYGTILKGFASLSFPNNPVAPANLWFAIADDMRARGYALTVEDYTRFLTGVSAKTTMSQEAQPPIISAPSQEQDRIQSINAMYTCVQYIHKRFVLDANISPDSHLLNTLMNVYQHLGAFEDALRVFNLIWLSGRMDAVTPIIIFDACGHAGRQTTAYMIWCMLVAKGWKFDKRTLDTWVECLCRNNVEVACRFVCVYMGRENAGYMSEGDTRPDVQTCLILLKLSWLQGQNSEVKARIRAHLPHIWDKLTTRYQ